MRLIYANGDRETIAQCRRNLVEVFGVSRHHDAEMWSRSNPRTGLRVAPPRRFDGISNCEKSAEGITRGSINLIDDQSAPKTTIVVPRTNGRSLSPLPAPLTRGHPRTRNLTRREVFGADQAFSGAWHAKMKRREGLSCSRWAVQKNSRHARLKNVREISPALSFTLVN
jgi:hypothetical protein